MFSRSIRQKIVGIAVGLIILMIVTSVLSNVMASKVGLLLDELTNKYIPAYGHLAQANVRSLERALALVPHGAPRRLGAGRNPGPARVRREHGQQGAPGRHHPVPAGL